MAKKNLISVLKVGTTVLIIGTVAGAGFLWYLYDLWKNGRVKDV